MEKPELPDSLNLPDVLFSHPELSPILSGAEGIIDKARYEFPQILYPPNANNCDIETDEAMAVVIRFLDLLNENGQIYVLDKAGDILGDLIEMPEDFSHEVNERILEHLPEFLMRFPKNATLAERLEQIIDISVVVDNKENMEITDVEIF